MDILLTSLLAAVGTFIVVLAAWWKARHVVDLEIRLEKSKTLEGLENDIEGKKRVLYDKNDEYTHALNAIDEHERIKPELEDLRRQLGELEPRRKELESFDAEHARLINEIDLKQNELGEKSTKLGELNGEIGQRGKEVEDLRKQLEALKPSVEKHQRLEADLPILQSKIKEATDKHQQLSAELDEIEKRRHEIIDETDAANSELVKRRAECESLSAEIEDARENLSGLESKVDECKTRRDELERELGGLLDLRAELDRIEKTITEKAPLLQQLVDDLAVKTQELARLCNGIEGAMAQKADLESGILRLNGEIQERSKEIEGLKTEFEVLKPKVDELRRLEAELPILQARVEEATEKNQELSETLAAKRQEHAKLSGEAEGLKSQKESMGKEIAELNKTLEILRKNVEEHSPDSDPKERYADLFKLPNFEVLSALDGSIREDEALRNTAKYIKDKGYTFHERTLHAFHTALKINDISPIVVLAGISGTGKSALPRLYAEGMGIHFVSLAVQPRWDNPQDLFGFYNYLEKSYKATELAQALISFDKFFDRKTYDEVENYGDRLLLALLDEMNLARVEYYFSEFLSKLEARRDIDPEKNAQRAKADILLDSREIRVFPGRNILFAGTMNEDETTQTLSDKVLDRSCVLRFGKPNKTVSRQNNQGGNAVSAKNGLTYNQWNGWCKQDDKSGKEEDFVKSIDKVLNDVGRPIGHRVRQSILAYLANYPDIGKDRINYAKFDLIEQKVLPKLRGLMVEEHRGAFDEVEKIIKNVGDDPLAKAFDEGRKKDVFIWQGIDRN